MENSGRPYRPRQGGWERGAAASDKAENWRIQDQGRGQNFRSEGGQQGKNHGGPYRASPTKGGLGPMSYSPGGFRGGHSPSQRDDLRWFSGPENSSGGREDNWRERSQQQQQQHSRRNLQGEGPKEDREQGYREASDSNSYKSGEDLKSLLRLSPLKRIIDRQWCQWKPFKNEVHYNSLPPYNSYPDHIDVLYIEAFV